MDLIKVKDTADRCIGYRTDSKGIKYTEYYKNNKLHHSYHPAIQGSDGSEEWYLEGNKLTKEEFSEFIQFREIMLKDVIDKYLSIYKSEKLNFLDIDIERTVAINISNETFNLIRK